MSIAMHSILIGLGVGVSSDLTEIRALMIALIIHQFFEGIAIGAMVRQSVGNFKVAFTILLFTSTCSIGIAIGTKIYGEEGRSSRNNCTF